MKAIKPTFLDHSTYLYPYLHFTASPLDHGICITLPSYQPERLLRSCAFEHAHPPHLDSIYFLIKVESPVFSKGAKGRNFDFGFVQAGTKAHGNIESFIMREGDKTATHLI